MPRATVNPINTVSVRVNQQNQPVVHNTSSFVGAADVQQQVNEIAIIANTAITTANNALYLAQNAYNTANNKLDLSGGTITGNLNVLGTFSTDHDTVDGGLF